MLRNSLSAGLPDVTFSYGFPSDYPVVGDWDGNGTDTPGVVRASTWYLKNSNASPGVADVSFAYGFASDLAVAGDWNGDGTDTAGVKRRSSWQLRNSNTADPADLTFSYGLGCDLGFAAPGAISRGRGGKGLPAALRGTELSTVATTQNVVALTFDAGANADAVPSILSTLESSCVPATFFLTGDWVDDFPADARRIAVRYPVGNHSDTHPHLPALSDAAVRDEINRAERIIQGSTRFNPGRCSASRSGSATTAPCGSSTGCATGRSAGPLTPSAGWAPPAARASRRSPTGSWPTSARVRSCSCTSAPIPPTAPPWTPTPCPGSSPSSSGAATGS